MLVKSGFYIFRNLKLVVSLNSIKLILKVIMLIFNFYVTFNLLIIFKF